MTIGYIEFWYQALRSEIGIEVETDNPERLRQRLYKERTESMDSSLNNLSIIISPSDPFKLWIVKRNAKET